MGFFACVSFHRQVRASGCRAPHRNRRLAGGAQGALKAEYRAGVAEAAAVFVDVRLLGPLELGRTDGTVSTLGSARERTALAVLAVRAGLVVETDTLIDAIWGTHPPAGARHALHVHMSALRRTLGPRPSPLESRPTGYVLRLAAGQLDTERFEELAATGRAELASGRPAAAVMLLDKALRLWRGPALVDVPWERFASGQVARLEEARRSAEEDRVDAELAAGHPHRAVQLSQTMIDEEPFRERRWCQAMLALYRCGRQAHALDTFAKARSLLRDELGSDPSPDLRTLHARLLAHDPALAAPMPSVDTGTRPRGPIPVTRFARNAECALAYQVIGDGTPDMVFIPGFTGHLEVRWEDPSLSHLYRRLARRFRLILLDKRGTGMSDRGGGFPPLRNHVDDVLCVMDAVGSRRAVLFGVLDGGSIALLAAVAHPARVVGVVTYATIPAFAAPDYPHAPTPIQIETLATVVNDQLDVDHVLPLWAPSRVGDQAFAEWFTRYMRMGAGVGGAADIVRQLLASDIRPILPRVTAPTLVLHRRHDRANDAANARYLARAVPTAELVLLPGDDTVLWAGDVDAIAAAIEAWIPATS
jgi:DNA-binding SARP family transcriptional activator/pimeloyl-ACP methyl ester carboxylesterase